MSRKSKGECTCKIVAQNERGMLGQVRDSVYRGVKYCGDGGQLKCYAIMATAQGGVRPAMVLTDWRVAYDMCAALEAAGAVLTEKVSYEVVETILRH